MSAVPEDPLPSAPKKPRVKIQVMVDHALKSLNERSGSSVKAIKKFLNGAYALDPEKSSKSIKKYIVESVASGKIIQTKGIGLSGSYKLSPAALKEPKPKKPKVKSKPKEATDKVKVKKTKETKDPKTKKDAQPKKTAGSVEGKEVKPKKTAGAGSVKKVNAPQKTAAAEKKKATEPAKKKPAKKQEAEASKDPPKKKAPAKKQVKSPAKKKGKENIPPVNDLQAVAIASKEEPLLGSPGDDNEGSEDSFTKLPSIKELKKAPSFDDASNDEDTEIPEGLEKDELEPDVPTMDGSDLSDGSISPKKSPEKVKSKGKVGGRAVKKRRSIATLANSAKPKASKR